jgi:hypothetical protein
VQFLHHDQVADELGHRLEALDPDEHDAAADGGVPERFGEWLHHRLDERTFRAPVLLLLLLAGLALLA